MRLAIADNKIIWPGKVHTKPEGFILPTHLKVLTIEEKPFVYTRLLKDDDKNCTADEIKCPHFNNTNDPG